MPGALPAGLPQGVGCRAGGETGWGQKVGPVAGAESKGSEGRGRARLVANTGSLTGGRCCADCPHPHPPPQVVFATPGMLHAGQSLQIFRKWAGNEKNMVRGLGARRACEVGQRWGNRGSAWLGDTAVCQDRAWHPGPVSHTGSSDSCCVSLLHQAVTSSGLLS